MAWHLRAGGQEDFSVDQEMNLYLCHSRVAAPDMFLYRHRPISIGETQGPFGSLPRAIRAFGPASGIKADPILESTLLLGHRSAQEGKTRVENRSDRDETLGHNEAVLPIRRTP